MPLHELIIRSQILEGKDIWTLARVTGNDRIALLQAGVSSASLEVYDLTSETAETSIYSSGALTVSSIIFDTLQTGGEWDADDVGYNFSHRVTSANFEQEGGHTYALEYDLVTANFGTLPIVHHVEVIPRHT